MGKGGFGKVWKVQSKKTKDIYALKEMSKLKIIDKKSEKSINSEREFLSLLHNPFIVNMHYAFQDSDNLYLVMDMLSGGDLRYHISRHRKFSEEQTRFFIACMILALEHIHGNNVIHRDIKPENLVLDENGYVRITDFGIAKLNCPDNSSETSGTPGYMSPEVMKGFNHSFPVDFFAIGVIGYEFMNGRRPYVGRNRKEIKEKMLAEQAMIKKEDLIKGWSYESADFINKLLLRKPEERLGYKRGVKELKEHPWLKYYPWKELEKKTLPSPFIPEKTDNFDKRYCESVDRIGEETKLRYEEIMLNNHYRNAFKKFYFNKEEYTNRMNQNNSSTNNQTNNTNNNNSLLTKSITSDYKVNNISSSSDCPSSRVTGEKKQNKNILNSNKSSRSVKSVIKNDYNSLMPGFSLGKGMQSHLNEDKSTKNIFNIQQRNALNNNNSKNNKAPKSASIRYNYFSEPMSPRSPDHRHKQNHRSVGMGPRDIFSPGIRSPRNYSRIGLRSPNLGNELSHSLSTKDAKSKPPSSRRTPIPYPGQSDKYNDKLNIMKLNEDQKKIVNEIQNKMKMPSQNLLSILLKSNKSSNKNINNIPKKKTHERSSSLVEPSDVLAKKYLSKISHKSSNSIQVNSTAFNTKNTLYQSKHNSNKDLNKKKINRAGSASALIDKKETDMSIKMKGITTNNPANQMN
ncbi:MAG: protein kinase [archaeon]|nr:protein kinase [archaeon]